MKRLVVSCRATDDDDDDQPGINSREEARSEL